MIHFKPVRTNAFESVKIISDFDALVSEEVGFKFMGQVHILKPVNVENFMKITLAYQKLIETLKKRADGETLTDHEVFDRYYELIHPIVPSLSFNEVESMTLVMLNNLVNLVLRQLSGDPSLYEKETQKKNSLIQ